MQFIAVIQAILFAGKQLQQFHIDEEDDNCSSESIIGSKLLRKLILSASSSGLINIAAKLLSTISKEAADQGDFPNLMIIYSDQYPKVYMFSTRNVSSLSTVIFLILSCTVPYILLSLSFLIFSSFFSGC